ncbi:hypothetical protein CFter6_4377 [Collimonas fungivorans]|uniref:Uncharacterized protein n=1 Tax=Collimonas fungivorans TaxID=158899 RepID=A0A127PGW9_9BURK|nr:hypothetical protein [Collimonas fungivorans]AMO96973.1 hypothetical protein CFter6_4377 [Collimonas fungivorans]
MRDSRLGIKMRSADASPELDFVRPQTHCGVPLMLLGILMAGVLGFLGHRYSQQTDVAVATLEKPAKILAAKDADTQESKRAQPVVADRVIEDKPVVARILPAQDNKVKVVLKTPPKQHRPAPRLPSRVAAANLKEPVGAVRSEGESAERRDPGPQQVVMHEVTLTRHVRLTAGSLN